MKKMVADASGLPVAVRIRENNHTHTHEGNTVVPSCGFQVQAQTATMPITDATHDEHRNPLAGEGATLP